MENYHAVEVKYLPVTNSRGSRIKLTSYRFQQSVTIPFDYQYNSAEEIAIAYLTNHGHPVIGQAEYKNGTTILFIDAVDGRFKLLKN